MVAVAAAVGAVNVAAGGGGGKNASPKRGARHAAIATRHAVAVLGADCLLAVGCRVVSRFLRRVCMGIDCVAVLGIDKVTEGWRLHQRETTGGNRTAGGWMRMRLDKSVACCCWVLKTCVNSTQELSTNLLATLR